MANPKSNGDGTEWTGERLYRMHVSGGGDMTHRQLIEATGLTLSQERHRIRKYVQELKDLAPEGEGPRYQRIPAADIVRELRGSPKSAKELSLRFDRSEATIALAIAEMVRDKYSIVLDQQRVMVPDVPLVDYEPQPLFPRGESAEITFAVVSDTHGGSKFEQVTALADFVHVATEEYGVKTILHAGDVFAGKSVYRGQESEVYAVSGEDQADAVANNLPQAEGLRWYILGGNHDYAFYKIAGLDARRELAERRDDVTLLPYDAAEVPLLPGVDARLWHPSGGVPYALCLSEDTEILTKRGWVGYDTICMADEVATLNRETGIVEYQKPEEMFIERYVGPMYHFLSRTVDHLVTPQHELWVRPYNEARGDGKWQKVSAKALSNPGRQKWQMSMVGEWKGDEIKTFRVPFRSWSGARDLGEMDADAFLAFLGWYISEGRVQQGKIACVTNTDELEVTAIKACMKAIGLNVRIYKEERSEHKPVFRVRGHNASLCRWLKKECGDRAQNKRVPRFVMRLSQRQVGIFLDALFAGDGTKKEGRRWFVYNSVSKQLRDDVQELLLKVGAAGTVGERTVGILEQNMPTVNRAPDVVDYDGLIWCVKVPNGIIYARRNGKPIWTGNSYRGQKGAAQIAQDELMQVVMGDKARPTIRLLVIGHLHVQYMFDHGPMVVLGAGCFEGQNGYLKRKQLVPHIGAWVIRCQFVDQMLHRITPVRFRYREIEDDWRPYWSKRQAKRVEAEEMEPIFSLDVNS